jgi:hypothetical protein
MHSHYTKPFLAKFAPWRSAKYDADTNKIRHTQNLMLISVTIETGKKIARTIAFSIAEILKP